MASRRINESEAPRSRRPPATTPESREHQLVSLATDVAEQQMRDGTASAQVVSYYLKLGSTREKLEQERLRNENKLLVAKVESLESNVRMEELYADAIKAMTSYAGLEAPDDAED